MKKLLLSLMALVCSMSLNAQTKGTATRTGDIEVNWVQLWENGPKFAEYNVGAENNKAEDYGGYYGWGKSIDKDPNESNKDGNDTLTGNDDTAINLWGSNWRMPTQNEFLALLDNCNVEWTTVNSVNGCKFTGKGDYSSNSMFLPAAGKYGYGNVQDKTYYGHYWSSTPSGIFYSYRLYFYSNFQSVADNFRFYGSSVRAVLAVEPDTPTAIEGVADNAGVTARGKKVIDGGKLIIIGNNGKMYNTVGVETKK